jgi:hypothetical protein
MAWRLATVALGIWLMVAPAVPGHAIAAAASDRIAGPVIATIGTVAAWEVVRAVRWLALAPAAWLIVAPFALGFGGMAAVNSVVVGLLTAALTPPRGAVTGAFGGGWRSLAGRRAPGAGAAG